MTQWADLRVEAVGAFEEFPGQELEAEIVAIASQLDAGIVRRTIQQIGEQKAQGKVRAAWPLLKHRLNDALSGPSSNAAIRDADAQRTARVEATQRWIANAGLHIDRPDELLDAVFGLGGQLREWADDEQLRDRVLEWWRQARPRAVALEKADREAHEAAQMRAREHDRIRREREEQRRRALADADRATAERIEQQRQTEAEAVGHA